MRLDNVGIIIFAGLVGTLIVPGCQSSNVDATNDRAQMSDTADRGGSESASAQMADGTEQVSEGGGAEGGDSGNTGDSEADNRNDDAVGLCQAQCDRFKRCLSSECQNRDTNYLTAMADECEANCVADPMFVTTAASKEACADLVVYVLGSSERMLQNNCTPDPGDLPVQNDCQTFADGYVQCLIDACPAAETDRDVLIGSAAQFCSGQSSQGNFDPSQAAMLYGDNLDCTRPEIANGIQYRVSFDSSVAGSGELATYCESGSIRSRDECDLACENLAGCLPLTSPLAVFRNRDRCLDLCLTREGPSNETWTCRASSMDCTDFNACGELTDASACTPVGENAGRCLAEACEPAGDVVEKMSAALTQICEGQLKAGQIQPVTVRDEDARTSCERGLAYQYVTFLTVPNEMDRNAGSLAPFCRSGAGVDVSVCEQACEYLGPCIPDSSQLVPLRNRITCEYFCLTDQNTVDATWTCLSEATECSQAGPCFQR